MGFISDFVSDPIGTVGSTGQKLIDTVKEHPLEAAALGAAGWYFAPQIGSWFSPTTGEAVAGTATGATAGAATSALTTAQLAKLGLTAASLLGAAGTVKALSSAGGGTGGLGLTQQDRSGFSSGSANYSPEYYAALQSKYNQYMPQNKGADITTDLKNWYETKYTPNVTQAGTSTLNTTGTGYTTPTSLANLNIAKQTVAPTYSVLSPEKSTATDIGSEYAKYIANIGGNTVANRSAALDFLRNKGFSDAQINEGYNQYLSKLPTATGTTAETLAANSTPAQIAQAYGQYVATAGGDNPTTQAAAIKYLQDLGVPYTTIQAAYPIYKSSVASTPAPTTGGGMLTGSTPTSPVAASAPAQPLYTSLSSGSTPAEIAQAYAQFVASAGGDTQANQQAAVNYLNNLGVNQDTIGQAYGLFKG